LFIFISDYFYFKAAAARYVSFFIATCRPFGRSFVSAAVPCRLPYLEELEEQEEPVKVKSNRETHWKCGCLFILGGVLPFI